MAFPAVSSITETQFGSDTTAHLVDMPGTVDAGDLLLVFLAFDAGPTITIPIGWTWLQWTGNATDVRIAIFGIDAIGDEDSTTVDFVTSISTSGSAQCYRITGWGGSLQEHVWLSGEDFGGGGNHPDPKIIGIPWGSTDDTLIIAAAATDNDTVMNSAPTSYTDLTQTLSGGGGGSISTARREVNADTEDPGAFTLATTEGHGAFTVAIAPTAYVAESGDEIDWAGAVWNRTFLPNPFHDVRMPASVAAGDLLLVAMSFDDTIGTNNTPTGWTELRSLTTSGGATLEIWGKDADGSEGGTDVLWTTAGSEEMAAVCLIIPADQWAGDLANDVDVSSGAGNSTPEATIDPDSVTTGWSGETNRFFAIGMGDGSRNSAATVFPTNYTRHMYIPDNTMNAANRQTQLSISTREATTDTENPSTWTFPSSLAWNACTIAIRPAAAGATVNLFVRHSRRRAAA